jgi:hypothetical protein
MISVNLKDGSMFKLKVYVGLDNKFVLCERFPNDEFHGGLHDMLQDFVDYDSVLIDENDDQLEQGFYEIELEIDKRETYDSPEVDAYFVLKSYKRIEDKLGSALRILQDMVDDEWGTDHCDGFTMRAKELLDGGW